MSPTSVSVRSYKVGQATIAWAPPFYAGGVPVTKYEITARLGNPGRPTGCAFQAPWP